MGGEASVIRSRHIPGSLDRGGAAVATPPIANLHYRSITGRVASGSNGAIAPAAALSCCSVCSWSRTLQSLPAEPNYESLRLQALRPRNERFRCLQTLTAHRPASELPGCAELAL